MRPATAKQRTDGELTRAHLIDTARKVFQQVGVNGCGLDRIASQAGVTRGAVYWHFANKADLFFAMLEEVRSSLKHLLHAAPGGEEDPLGQLERRLQAIFQRLSHDVAAREVLEILLFRCEYVGPFAAVQATIRTAQEACIDHLVQCYRAARTAGTLRAGLDPEALAVDTLHFVSSLLEQWLADRQLRSPATINGAIACHLALRRAVPEKEHATG